MARQIIIILCDNKSEMSIEITRGKEHHMWLAQKLSGSIANSKQVGIFWKIYNGKKSLNISPLSINNKLESDFKIKANYFNSFFASKSTLLVNSSARPNSPQYVSTARLPWFCFNEEFISKIINDLNTNKAHGHDDKSIWMINQVI